MMSNSAADPWRISNEERAKHDQQFFQLNPVNGLVSGEQAKSLFMQSGLPMGILGQIWGLADMNADGKMDRHEFSIAMHLIHLKLKGLEIPKVLPAILKNPPAPTMGTFGAAMGLGGIKPPMPNPQNSLSGPRPVITNGSILMGQNFSSNIGGNAAMPVQAVSSNVGPAPLPSAGFEPRSRTTSTSSQDSVSSLVEWAINHSAKLRYTQAFNTHDRSRTGFLSGNQARGILLQSALPQQILAKIWSLSDIDGDGNLTCEEFCVAMHLTEAAKAGDTLPQTLPLELIPPSYRRKRPSISAGGSPAISQLSMSSDSIDIKDELRGFNSNTFEDKRKMNFEKGQAELEKRRQALLESQRKEQEERERKEREEQEKRERIRQEQERRRQLELEKQLAKQRELEMEKEEQRRKAMEQREAARREMERQRQLEWEKQRRQDLMTQRQKEQESVCHLKSRNKNLTYDLEKMNEIVNELNGKITGTRSGVTEIKTSIDNMKGERDKKVTLINSLKLQLKEQNDRMLILSQEKAKLENTIAPEPENNQSVDSMNIVMHSFNNKQITLNQLHDVLSNLEKATSQKLLEINDNNSQLKDAKKELIQVIEKTDILRKDLERKRQEASSLQEKKSVSSIGTPTVEDPWGAQDSFNSKDSNIVEKPCDGNEDFFAKTDVFKQESFESLQNGTFDDVKKENLFGDEFKNHDSFDAKPFEDKEDGSNSFGNDAFTDNNTFASTSFDFAQQNSENFFSNADSVKFDDENFKAFDESSFSSGALKVAPSNDDAVGDGKNTESNRTFTNNLSIDKTTNNDASDTFSGGFGMFSKDSNNSISSDANSVPKVAVTDASDGTEVFARNAGDSSFDDSFFPQNSFNNSPDPSTKQSANVVGNNEDFFGGTNGFLDSDGVSDKENANKSENDHIFGTSNAFDGDSFFNDSAFPEKAEVIPSHAIQSEESDLTSAKGNAFSDNNFTFDNDAPFSDKALDESFNAFPVLQNSSDAFGDGHNNFFDNDDSAIPQQTDAFFNAKFSEESTNALSTLQNSHNAFGDGSDKFSQSNDNIFDNNDSTFPQQTAFETNTDMASAFANHSSNTNDIFSSNSAFSSQTPDKGNKDGSTPVFDNVQSSMFTSNASQSIFGNNDDAWSNNFDNAANEVIANDAPTDETVDDNKMIKYRALYAFESRNVDELSIMPGDIIMVPEKQNAEPGWLGGELKGKTGWFPAAYVEPVDGSAEDNQTQNSMNNDEVISPSSGTDETVHIVGTEMKMTLSGISEDPEHNVDLNSFDKDATVADDGTNTILQSEASSFTNVSKSNQLSMVDSASPIPGEGKEVEGLQAQALFPWRAKKDNHLTFNKNDIINVKEQQDMWWCGECDGKVGWFPKSYVKLIAGPKRADSIVEPNEMIEEQQEEPTNDVQESTGSYFMALYSYQSNEAGDLAFVQGDLILVTKTEGDWWTGSIGDKTGIFPSNYVQKVDSESTEEPIQDETNNTVEVESVPERDMEVSKITDQQSKPVDSPKLKGNKLRKPEIATVIAPYSATGSEQLSLKRGDLIQVRKRSPSGWWEGELQVKGKQRQIGWFPASYVKLLSSGNTPNTSARNTPDIMSHTENSNVMPSSQEQVTVLFSYTAQNSDEISLVKGEMLTIINKDDPSWWKGETTQGEVGLFPANYVQPLIEKDPSSTVNWSNEVPGLANLSDMERKRQNHIHELINTEQSYMEDMSIVMDVFYNPLKEAAVLTSNELQTIFVNWNELIICNIKILKALRVRKKMTSGFVINMIGDILCETMPHLSPYIRFCSCQLNAASLLQQKTERSSEFKSLAKKCAGDPRAKGMPLSSFLLKPMQRITKYPLLIKKILEHTPETHPDHCNLVEALHQAELICSEVNESVREKENSDRLEWLQTHVQCEGVMEQLTFNSLTNSVGPRKYLHSGTLIKAKSGKELMAFLVNDFLLLSVPIKPVPPSSCVFSSERSMNSWYKMYRQPLCLNDVSIKQSQENDETQFQVQHINQLYTFKAINNAEKVVWVKKINNAIQVFNEMEKKKLDRQNAQKMIKTSGMGRLLVVVCEGINLTPSSSNRDGKSDPYCEVNMGTQEHKTKVVPGSLNPKWNASMQFLVRDLQQDVLCITVYDRDLFSPNDFLGRTEIKVVDIYKATKSKKGPIIKKLKLHEVQSGEVTIKLDLQIFDFT